LGIDLNKPEIYKQVKNVLDGWINKLAKFK
jgi:hypothetical protein